MALVKNARDRRALVIMAIALGVFVVYKFGIARLAQDYRTLQESVETERKTLARELRLLQDAMKYVDTYKEADSSVRSLTPRLFAVASAEDDLLASHELRKYFEAVAQSSSVLVIEGTPLPATARPDGLRRLRVRIAAESDLEGILKMLAQIESGPRVVQIDSIDVRPGASKLNDSPNENVLQIGALVVGYAIDTTVVRGAVSPAANGGQGTRK